MKLQKTISLVTFQALMISSGLLLLPNVSSALECNFDSFLIIDGKCVNLKKKSNIDTNTVHRTIYEYSSADENSNIQDADKKICEDFNYQESAQRYFDRYPENKRKFDRDNDGFVCEHLERTSKNILTLEIWQKLKSENYQRKQQTKNQHSLSFREVRQIIGFSPNAKQKNRRHVWEDPMTGKRIEILFAKNKISEQYEILEMKGVKF